VQKELERDSPSFHRVLKSSYVGSFAQLIDFLKAGQALGCMRADLDPLTVAFSITGAMGQHLRLGAIRS
jgi:hypothetical protein